MVWFLAHSWSGSLSVLVAFFLTLADLPWPTRQTMWPPRTAKFEGQCQEAGIKYSDCNLQHWQKCTITVILHRKCTVIRGWFRWCGQHA